MESFNYTTVAGDRWDTLAARFYGNNAGIAILIDANSAVPITAVLPIGTPLVVPVMDDLQIIDKNILPPWKRSGK